MATIVPRRPTALRRPVRVGIDAVADKQQGVVAWAWAADPGDGLPGWAGPLTGSGTVDGRDMAAGHLAAVDDVADLVRACRGPVELQVDDPQVRAALEALALPAAKVVCGLSKAADARDACLRVLGLAADTRTRDEIQAALPRLLVGTDGSCDMRAHWPIGGWGWVDGEGRFGAGTGRVKGGGAGANVAEVRALLSAIKSHHCSRRLLVRSDSVVAVRLAQAIRSGRGDTFGVPLDVVARLRQAVFGRDVDFEWVPGHSGEPMNECADRLAVAARRGAQLGVDPAVRDRVLARIVDEYRDRIRSAQAAATIPAAESSGLSAGTG
ncbi:ribonuclease HI [Microlunatus ginsengisoli]|uniref:ribonuclease HI n=1 Tax=Microlunatus ginsengisoli TaxID=363863 RepID=UPI0031DD4A76